jgi:hypothetical protein
MHAPRQERNQVMKQTSLVPIVLVVFLWAGTARSEITALAVTPDGKTLLAAGTDGRVRLIDLTTRKQRAQVLAHQGNTVDLGLSADGKRFITCGSDKIVRIWDLAKVKEIRAYKGHKTEVFAVALSPDGKLAASGDQAGQIHLVEVDTGKERRAPAGVKHRVTSLAFSPDGKRLASGGIEPFLLPGITGMMHASRMRVEEIASGEVRELEERATQLAFLPIGNALAGVGWRINMTPAGAGFSITSGTRTVVQDLFRDKRKIALERAGRALCVSPDGRYLVTAMGTTRHAGGVIIGAGSTAGLQLHEIATGKVVWNKVDVAGGAAVVALSPDGRTLIAGDRADGLRFHAIEPADWKTPGKWKAADFKPAWETLTGNDPTRAYRAVWDWSAQGDEAVAFLRKQLKPAVAPGARVKKLIADLDSNEFETRQTAQKELDKLGEAAEPALRAASRKPASAEVKRALRTLLARLDRAEPPPKQLSARRAITILERIGNKEARALLANLAKGAPGADLTEEARLALARLAVRGDDHGR